MGLGEVISTQILSQPRPTSRFPNDDAAGGRARTLVSKAEISESSKERRAGPARAIIVDLLG